MIRITTPATSANLAVGFDSLALALSKYNTFTFTRSELTIFEGFETSLSTDSNLVFLAYTAYLKSLFPRREVQPVTITLEHQGIPISKGLGSSASCILAGVLASNHLHELGKSTEECVAFAAEYEGHPDNIYACMYGGLTSVFATTSGYIHHTFDVLQFLHFTLLIPETKGQTKSLRQAIPNMIPLEDAVFHTSRMIHIPRAFAEADLDLLKQLLQDRIHEQYRYPSIPELDNLMTVKNNVDGIMMISGSGPSILVISNHDISSQLASLTNTFELVDVKIASGTRVEVHK